MNAGTSPSRPRDVLIALCGLAPQVVTETLWALARRHPPVWPEEIWILTTEAGRQVCRKALFGKTGALTRYLREYDPQRRHPVRFGPDRVVVLEDAAGVPLDDVRTAADNVAVADQLASFMRRQTMRSDVRLHCSIAGGRKTMGILLAAVLQLYARPEDRLYHVLVSPEFEMHPKFFYKPKRACRLVMPDGRRLSTNDAVIELADIPYVRLRPFLADPAPRRFTDLVALAQAELHALAATEPVTLLPARHHLRIGSKIVTLRPQEWELYRALAQVKRTQCVKPMQPHCEDCTDCYLGIGKDNWEDAQARLAAQSLRPGLVPKDVTGFRSVVSKVNRAIAKALGSKRLARRYAIQAVGVRNGKAYGLATDKAALREET